MRISLIVLFLAMAGFLNCTAQEDYYSSDTELKYLKLEQKYRPLCVNDSATYLPNFAVVLYNLGNFYLINQKFEEAEKRYKETEKIYRFLLKKEPDKYLSDLVNVIDNLAILCKKNGQVNCALQFNNEAEKISRNLVKKDSTKYSLQLATVLNNFGNFYSSIEKVKESEKAYRESELIYRNLIKANPLQFRPSLAKILGNIGLFYAVNQKYTEAVKVYSESIEIYRGLKKEDLNTFLPDLANVLSGLGNLYEDNGVSMEAEKAYKEAVKIQKELVKERPAQFLPELAKSLKSLTDFYESNNRQSDAEKSYNDLLKIEEKLSNAKPPFVENVAVYVNDWEKLYQVTDKTEEKTLLEDIQRERKSANRDPAYLYKVALSMHTLGFWYSVNKKPVEAESAYDEAIKIWQSISPPNNYNSTKNNGLALSWYCLGFSYSANKQDAEAEKQYVEARTLIQNMETYQQGMLLAFADKLVKLNDIYVHFNRTVESEKIYEEAAKMYRLLALKNTNEILPKLSRTLTMLANYYTRNNKPIKAISADIEAIEIYKGLSDQAPNQYLTLLASRWLDLGYLYSTTQKKHTEAQKAYFEAVTIYKSLNKRTQRKVALNMSRCLTNLGNEYNKNLKNNEAEQCFIEAEEIKRSLVDKDKDQFAIDLAITLNNFGRFYLNMKRVEDGENKILESIGIFKDVMVIASDASAKKQIWHKSQLVLSNLSRLFDADSSVVRRVKIAERITDFLEQMPDGLSKEELAHSYGSMAWYFLFQQKFVEAEQSAKNGIEADGSQVWIYTNLAHSLLLQNKTQEAKAIYQTKQGLTYQGQLLKDTFLSDISTLEKFGIHHPDFRQVREWLKP